MRFILERLGLLKKKPAPKPAKPSRIAVHLPDGKAVVHYACRRTRTPQGGLVLHDKPDGAEIVAEYAPGAWTSFSTGKRALQKP